MSKRPLVEVESTSLEDPAAGIFKLSGKLFGDQSGYDLLEKIRDEIKEGRTHIILDLNKLTMANSSGLGIIASVFNGTKEVNGSLTLVGASEMIQKLLKVIMLWDLVQHNDTVEGAHAALKNP